MRFTALVPFAGCGCAPEFVIKIDGTGKDSWLQAASAAFLAECDLGQAFTPGECANVPYFGVARFNGLRALRRKAPQGILRHLGERETLLSEFD